MVCVCADAEASLSEKEAWEKVDKVLTEAQVILDELQAYTGAGEEIRLVMRDTANGCTERAYERALVNCAHVHAQAIQSPSEEGVQEKAWSAVLPLVAKLKRFYEFSHKLGNAFTRLLTKIQFNHLFSRSSVHLLIDSNSIVYSNVPLSR